jgi:hypothetical protein
MAVFDDTTELQRQHSRHLSRQCNNNATTVQQEGIWHTKNIKQGKVEKRGKGSKSRMEQGREKQSNAEVMNVGRKKYDMRSTGEDKAVWRRSRAAEAERRAKSWQCETGQTRSDTKVRQSKCRAKNAMKALAEPNEKRRDRVKQVRAEEGKSRASRASGASRASRASRPSRASRARYLGGEGQRLHDGGCTRHRPKEWLVMLHWDSRNKLQDKEHEAA